MPIRGDCFGQTPVDVSDVSVTDNIIIGWNHFEDSTGLLGADLATGRRLWTVKNTQFCATANNKVVITANG